MFREFKAMVLANAFLVALYLLWNWGEYSDLSRIYHVTTNANFPWYIQFSGSTQNGFGLIANFDFNFGLFLLLFAVTANLYLAYILQRQMAKP